MDISDFNEFMKNKLLGTAQFYIPNQNNNSQEEQNKVLDIELNESFEIKEGTEKYKQLQKEIEKREEEGKQKQELQKKLRQILKTKTKYPSSVLGKTEKYKQTCYNFEKSNKLAQKAKELEQENKEKQWTRDGRFFYRVEVGSHLKYMYQGKEKLENLKKEIKLNTQKINNLKKKLNSQQRH